ncbi:hypothetical protein ES703_100271 [subsurface metagenome]
MKYWALKTRESWSRQDFTDHWNDFKTESVIAIGWEKADVSPDKASLDEIAVAIKKAYGGTDKAATTNATTIQKFVSISPRDKILLCRGYAPNQVKKVHLYGTALVTGPFIDCASKNWKWRFRHKAKIDETFGPNGKDVSKEFLVQRLAKRALLQTLHEISQEGFERVIEDLGKS